MNIKAKTTLIIIITLAIGIVIGAMLNRALSQNRIRRILSRRNPPMFISFYERIIEPDDSQRELIRKILDKYAKRFSEIRTNFGEELESSIESMRAELDPILTPEQKERLKKGFPGRPPFPDRRPRRRDITEELATLKNQLNLSEDQASKIKNVLEELMSQAEIRREKEGFRGMQIIRELEEKKDKAIKDILTEDQKKMYEKMKNERRKKFEKEMREREKMIKEKDFPLF